uniref:NADH-ubiquinone oxidoreductase chain 5 n=1 Tax=Odorrana utsunomiyaorum TaxID=310663 RepID=A0A387J6K1_9NEOB|nr:NADH dehydrogenase subunit 5 [Odorrana utsunomiyaorum]BBD84829.1 NADH dehydrogenase subunit 5 [Odorrana utsunomiyaorum]BBD84831.1 NADH dehydrogenase subunit 5 [Odorrana utsunomiyaorum]BBD84833.1 NADH dehydrogenase subunit 5 [Odorrana utsunomiyaorum]BBD84837.1 NADH dehydrogenase subunit 5 [Odorrana utsunomiyaorum]
MLSPYTITFVTTVSSIMLIIWPLTNTESKMFYLAAKNAVKMAFFLSLPPLTLFMFQGYSNASASMKWFNLGITDLSFTTQFDMYSIIFLPVAYLVTWSILEFSMWYMQTDPNIKQFFKYLLIFLLAMIALVSAGNLLILFVGWEGVGIMSFLLIGWYHARSDAAAAALQAVLYNRLGDIGFLLTLCWLMKNTQSIELQHILSSNTSIIPLAGFITAAASKSAQFGFHPWLASAMEGPTPVSALLHSSTMVVAGIFLLIRVHPIILRNQTALTMCLCLGALSTLIAASYALTQNDIKKIIAYSTSSQLGLMMVAIGLNMPYLAFFHITTHAFFKAMLFLCSGLIIHSINDEQDIRKMGGLQHALPLTTTCLSIGSLALMGTPFLAGFYSKDAIIEATGTSHINSMALLMTLIATAFTAVYSVRLIYFISMTHARMNPTLLCDENDSRVLNPLTRLATGTIAAGLLINNITLSDHPINHSMPTYMKLTALIITIAAFTIAHDLTKVFWTTYSTNLSAKKYDPLFFNFITHRTSTTIILNLAWHLITHLTESILMKKLGPANIVTSQMQPTKIVRLTQTAQIKAYLSVLFITLVCATLVL